jgi:aryl-alcohol dehydrogenase-like predicted oxidoreductase
MPKRLLGNSGLEVSAIGLGCMGMNSAFPPFPDKQERYLRPLARITGPGLRLMRPAPRREHPVRS